MESESGYSLAFINHEGLASSIGHKPSAELRTRSKRCTGQLEHVLTLGWRENHQGHLFQEVWQEFLTNDVDAHSDIDDDTKANLALVTEWIAPAPVLISCHRGRLPPLFHTQMRVAQVGGGQCARGTPTTWSRAVREARPNRMLLAKLGKELNLIAGVS